MLIPWLAPEKQLSLALFQTTEQAMTLYLQLTTPSAFCPSCGTQSTQRHSFYTRKLQDLSIGMQHVQIHLQSRKWFCVETFCPKHIFTERFTWVQPYARKTERLQQLLRQLVFSMSCRQAERVTQPYLRRVSHDAFLRLIRATTVELPHTTAIGLDDFAFRKGSDYGTLICDLNTHQPLAILTGRTSEVVENWLRTQPQLQTVSRDGSKTYREAITNTNPAIVQVSDRWHLLKNAKDALFKWLEQKLPAQIEWQRIGDDEVIQPIEEKPIDELKWQLIQQVQQDYNEGIRITQLAQKYQVSRGTIYSYLKRQSPPRKARHRSKTAQLKLQPYYEAIIAYDAEHFTLNQIFKKIQAAGYDGSRSALRRFLEPYHAKKKAKVAQITTYSVPRVQLSQWIWRGFESLKEEQKHIVTHCQQLYPFLEVIEQLVQAYRTLFRERDVDHLLDWMNAQLANKNAPFYSYSMGLRLDLAAVKNAFILPYSNGLLEGQVNRLKWIKRMMYGRAKSDLLEKRMQYRL